MELGRGTIAVGIVVAISCVGVGCSDEKTADPKVTDGGRAPADAAGGTDATVMDGSGNGDTDATVMDGSGNGDAGAGGDAGGPTDAGGGAPTFSAIYTNIISVKCSPCHTTSASGGLAMPSRTEARTHLVGVPATAGGSCGGLGKTRVQAGDATNSLLWQKVSGTDLCGSRMPFGRTPLSPSEIDTIRDWINAGAGDN